VTLSQNQKEKNTAKDIGEMVKSLFSKSKALNSICSTENTNPSENIKNNY
jgi:hypothetical protein